MDRTELFRRLVRDARAREAAISSILANDNPAASPLAEKEEERPAANQKSAFASEARVLVNSITKLRDFLEKYRRDYLSGSVSLAAAPEARLSDADRDRVDAEAGSLVVSCNQLLARLRHTASGDDTKSDSPAVSGDSAQSQRSEHRELVLKLIEVYLKQVCDSYSEQRAIRVTKSIEKRQLSKLSSVSKTRPSAQPTPTQTAVPQPKPAPPPDVDFSPEEVLQLELENQQLQNELRGMEDQVESIELEVVEIARLQAIFSDKVLSQHAQTEAIHATTVSTTEDVKTGNEAVRNAIRNNAGLRFWVLFILVTCSFSLLFLDWYDT